MNDYQILRLNDQNFKDLSVIYQSAFGTTPNLDELKKKFNTSSFSEKNVGFIAYQNSEPAAFYGVFPCYMTINGKQYLVCQSGDTMTHENHRRKGLFIQLAKKTYELCESIGVNLVFGFPNENSYPGFVKKLDWIHENNIYCYRINSFSIKRKFAAKYINNNKKYNTEFSNKYLESISCKFRDYISLNDSSNNNLIQRDQLFHNYKQYFKKYTLEINGKLIYLKPSKDYLFIGDIENCNSKELKKIITELKKISNLLNIPFLRFNLSLGSEFECLIKKRAEKMNVIYPIGYTNFIGNLSLKNVHFSLLDYDTY